MNSSVQVFHFEGEGLERSYQNSEWMVGVKNYNPRNDIKNLNFLERHLLTDELFIPLTEGSFIITAKEPDRIQMQVQRMNVGNIYCVPKEIWHNAIMSEDSKIILVERSDTGKINSEVYSLSTEQIARLLQLKDSL